MTKDGYHKIGLSVRPESRAVQLGAELLWQIRTGNMLWLERYLHVAFSDCRIQGEWFQLPPDAVNMLLNTGIVHTEADIPEPIRVLHVSALETVVARAKIAFDIPEPVRRAIAIYAAERNYSVGQVIEEMARDHIPDHITRAEEAIAAGDTKPVRKGRPPKPTR